MVLHDQASSPSQPAGLGESSFQADCGNVNSPFCVNGQTRCFRVREGPTSYLLKDGKATRSRRASVVDAVFTAMRVAKSSSIPSDQVLGSQDSNGKARATLLKR